MAGFDSLLQTRVDEPEPDSDSGRPPRRGRRIAVLVLISVAAVIALAATALVVLVQRDPSGEAALAGTIPPRPVPTGVANGAFTGAETWRFDAYVKWLGGDLDRVVMFSDRDTWAQIADPRDMIKEWRGSRYRMVDSVALLPEKDPTATIALGASGAYDRYFTDLARNLVKGRQGDAILRLGWEFNLKGSRWHSDDPQAFIAYWRHVVAAMRAVPGQHFQFDWNPNNGKAVYDAVKYYPGDDVVDYIGIDAYDVSYAWRAYPYPSDCDAACRTSRQTVAWDKSIYGGKRGLKFWSQFAQHKGKPMSIPEWGLWNRLDNHGGGDDPAYLRRMHDFIVDPRNDVAYQAYFEFDGADGPHKLMTTFADSGDTFRALFAHP